MVNFDWNSFFITICVIVCVCVPVSWIGYNASLPEDLSSTISLCIEESSSENGYSKNKTVNADCVLAVLGE